MISMGIIVEINDWHGNNNRNQSLYILCVDCFIYTNTIFLYITITCFDTTVNKYKKIAPVLFISKRTFLYCFNFHFFILIFCFYFLLSFSVFIVRPHTWHHASAVCKRSVCIYRKLHDFHDTILSIWLNIYILIIFIMKTITCMHAKINMRYLHAADTGCVKLF